MGLWEVLLLLLFVLLFRLNKQKTLPKKIVKITRFQVLFFGHFYYKTGENELLGQNAGGKSV